ncbi:DUF1259 domain-containing protein [Desmospora profundinema]|uniref:DUF1259 domain-containing protein n=1 Tax=Desmospora profundinema TaxID=1571184 RepID=A0ABU1IQX9_9BACL|nr:DUF1259 domain-containing protein [Desmospora profundinema]MDR6227201.1 hypothetical protein [Desmospora profundinema]
MRWRSWILIVLFTISLLSMWSTQTLHAEESFCQQIKQETGLPATLEKGICTIIIPREDIKARLEGVPLPGEMLDLELSAHIIKTGKKGYLTAEFALLEKEINPVIDRVRQSGISVSALHNHWIHEHPRILYLHFQGSGDPVELATTVKQAVQATTVPSH